MVEEEHEHDLSHQVFYHKNGYSPFRPTGGKSCKNHRVAIYLDSLIAIATVALFMTFMLIFVKLTEERRLLKEFGSDYEEYRQRVSMFVPWMQKRPRSLSTLGRR